MLRVAVTGHRPNKLGGYDKMFKLKEFARECFEQYKDQIGVVYTGMALGWDQAVALACVELEIPFIACVPFEGQEKMWPKSSQLNYQELCSKAKEIVCVSGPGYSSWKMQLRNQYMVDSCDRLVAMWDGTEGGTKNCVDYADLKKIKIYNWYDGWTKYMRGGK